MKMKMIRGPNDPFDLRFGARMLRDYELKANEARCIEAREENARQSNVVKWVGHVLHDNVQGSDLEHPAVAGAEDAEQFVHDTDAIKDVRPVKPWKLWPTTAAGDKLLREAQAAMDTLAKHCVENVNRDYAVGQGALIVGIDRAKPGSDRTAYAITGPNKPENCAYAIEGRGGYTEAEYLAWRDKQRNLQGLPVGNTRHDRMVEAMRQQMIREEQADALTAPTDEEIRDYYRRAGLRRISTNERQIFEARLALRNKPN